MGLEWSDYQVRVWNRCDRLVDIELSEVLLYSSSNQGFGMQTLACPDSDEYGRVMELCDSVRESILALDDYLRELQG